MKTKYIDKRSWRRLLNKDYKEIIIEDEHFNGIVGLITMKKVKSPLEVEVVGQPIVVADVGYEWLQILPKDEHYSMTVMYNDKQEALQYYIDINEKNYVEPGEARTHDLFLDVLVLPDGSYDLVDEEDLKRAYRNKSISKEQYDFAYATAKEIMSRVENDFGTFRRMAEYCREKITA